MKNTDRLWILVLDYFDDEDNNVLITRHLVGSCEQGIIFSGWTISHSSMASCSSVHIPIWSLKDIQNTVDKFMKANQQNQQTFTDHCKQDYIYVSRGMCVSFQSLPNRDWILLPRAPAATGRYWCPPSSVLLPSLPPCCCNTYFMILFFCSNGIYAELVMQCYLNVI